MDDVHQYKASLIEKENRLKMVVTFQTTKFELKKEESQETTYTEDIAQESQDNPEEDVQMEEEFIESENEEGNIKNEVEHQLVDIKFIENSSESHYIEVQLEDNQFQLEVEEETIAEGEEEMSEQTSKKQDITIPKLKSVYYKAFPHQPPAKKPRKTQDVSNCDYKCWISNCNYKFPHRISLKRHMNSIHNVIVSKSTCLICGESFETYVDFLSHSKVHRKYLCDFCQSCFSKSDALDNHLEKFHKANDEEDRPFHCQECNATFKRNEHLKSHIAYKHTSGKIFS